jgi:hypothetical protein
MLKLKMILIVLHKKKNFTRLTIMHYELTLVILHNKSC